MRLSHFFVAAALAGACGSSSNSNNFPTFQACFDEHTQKEGFDTQCAVEICCIAHGIGSAKMNTVCGDTTQSCDAYATANLTVPTDPNLAANIMTGCSSYPLDSGRTTTGTSGMCGS